MSSAESEPQPEPIPPRIIDPEYGYTFHLTMDDAMDDAMDNPGRVVVFGGQYEAARWVTCWKAQPLARFLTRGGQVVWQGSGSRGHWDEL